MRTHDRGPPTPTAELQRTLVDALGRQARGLQNRLRALRGVLVGSIPIHPRHNVAMLIERREGSVEPDYAQFYLKTGTGDYASDRVTGPGYEVHLEASAPGFVYVGTLKKFYSTPVTLEVHDGAPEPPTDEWQHIVEVPVTGDGVLEVLSWGSNEAAMTISTPVGPLRLRAMWTGLVPGLAEGLPEEGNSDERLVFQLWPAPKADRKVVLCWPEWDLPGPTSVAPDGRRQIEGVDEVVAQLKGLIAVPVTFGLAPGRSRPLPGGTSGYLSGIWGDVRDSTWWVDGYDIRRTLRVASPEEVRELLRHAEPLPHGLSDPRWREPRWIEMLRSVGYVQQDSHN
jgi:hypothetical protein